MNIATPETSVYTPSIETPRNQYPRSMVQPLEVIDKQNIDSLPIKIATRDLCVHYKNYKALQYISMRIGLEH